MKKILVTGGTGYIGSQVVWNLVDSGFDVVVIDINQYNNPNPLPKGVPVFVFKIGDTHSVAEILRHHKIDAVMHLAASIDVAESTEKPDEYYENNVSETIGLLKAMRQEKVMKIIFSSTAAIYGDASCPVKENTPCAPTSPYGWSKIMAEQIINDQSLAWGLRSVKLRYFNVAGADRKGRTGQQNKFSSLMESVIASALSGKPFEVLGTDYDTPDGSAIRDLIHVVDVARAHTWALEYLNNDESQDVTVNIGSGTGYSVFEIVEVVKAIYENLEIGHGPRRDGDIVESYANTGLAKRLGFVPLYGLDDIVHDLLAKHDD